LVGVVVFLYGCNQKIRSGDLVFVGSEDSDFEKSIVEVTKFENYELNFTHVGLVNVTDSGTFVVEAVPGKGVIYSSFADFKSNNNNSSLFIGKLKPKYQKFALAAISRAYAHLGKEYDYAFDFENDDYYCSELVYEAYAHASADPLFFETPNMSFKQERSDEFLPYWVSYFEQQNIPVPEGKPGVNPTGLSRSDKFRVKKLSATGRI